MTRKSKKVKDGNKFVKGGLATILGGAIVTSYARKLLFGNPPSKIRQGIVYGALGAWFSYNVFGLDKFYEDFKESRSDVRLERIHDLSEINSVLESKVDSLLDVTHEYQLRLNTKKSELSELKKAFNNSDDDFKNIFWYVVKPGDNLGNIAQQLTGSKKYALDLAKFNNIRNPNNIHPGQPLIVPVGDVISYSLLRSDPRPTNIEFVREGEHIDDFVRSRDLGVSTREFLEYNSSLGNPINRTNRLFSGSVFSNDRYVYIPK